MLAKANVWRVSLWWLLQLTWISCYHDVLQHIPVQYLYLVANEYFHNKHSLVDIRNRFLDLLGDVFFVIPGLVTAQYHTGKSPRTPPPARLVAAGIPLPVYWRPPALPCPAVPLLRGSSQGCLGYSPACWPSQFPCLSEFRNVDQALLILVLSFLQDCVEKSHPPIFSEAGPHLPFSLECVRVHAQLCLTLCDSVGYNLPVFQAIILEQVANSYSRGSSRPRNQTHVSCIGRWILY